MGTSITSSNGFSNEQVTALLALLKQQSADAAESNKQTQATFRELFADQAKTNAASMEKLENLASRNFASMTDMMVGMTKSFNFMMSETTQSLSRVMSASFEKRGAYA